MPAVDAPMTVTVENARLLYRNFAGKEAQYNREGDRNFSVVLDPETAEKMIADGWNVRVRDPREDGDEPSYLIQVAVSFKNRPPKIVMITSNGRTHLTEDTVEVLDYADIELVDLIFRSYSWEVNGKVGIKAYLQTMYVTINEDELERKYDKVSANTQSED